MGFRGIQRLMSSGGLNTFTYVGFRGFRKAPGEFQKSSRSFQSSWGFMVKFSGSLKVSRHFRRLQKVSGVFMRVSGNILRVSRGVSRGFSGFQFKRAAEGFQREFLEV